MSIGQMRQVVSTSGDVQQLQSSLNEQFSQLGQIPILNGVLLTGVALASGTTSVNHQLGRMARGYLIVSKSANATIWNGSFTDSAIPFNSSAACSVDVWVF